jgi:hypothetical protein
LRKHIQKMDMQGMMVTVKKMVMDMMVMRDIPGKVVMEITTTNFLVRERIKLKS